MEFLYLIFYTCMRLQFLDMETNPGLRRPVPAVCRILCNKVRVLARNLSDQTVGSSQYDMLGDFGLRYASRVGVAGSQFRSLCLIINNSSTSFCLRSSSCRTALSIYLKPTWPTTILMFF